MQRVIGLISGTSVDGIDAALVEISGREMDLAVNLLAAETYSYPPALREQILALCAGVPLSLKDLAALDDAIAAKFAEAALAIQVKHPQPVDLIGSHGQTVYHRPPTAKRLGYTLQLGRGDAIAQQTRIPTVTNMRAADIAVGGQGAPLVSKLDVCLLSHPQKARCVQNIGGIGNLTFLPAQTAQTLPDTLLGWDTGPGNVLLDLAVQHLTNGQQTYDQNGAWAATGKPCTALVDTWLQDNFFYQPPPKSTGRELFGPDYLQQCLATAPAYDLDSADFLASLTELTARSIVDNYRRFLPQMPQEVLLCGGGSHNAYLRQRLQAHLDPIPVRTTTDVGLHADAKEAIAFAVLAYWRWHQIPGNLPAVTGAHRPVVLGDLCIPF
ncbi:anhydro-N-acetylmuramic acid kinase [Synechococcales cyanobacterium C]|uniref:Anhydro-N-acetylmuramic acid kinase n=1 Tax=Petrachloros mirabilis ULC683 TaxID=2781853 RepID=A0A8K1ZWZ1_9CYAN|nr:anhydro-N-acetylmuramic acid kinase [Petrachloros mirabilis]NCJ06423.1 anhydro-N-acetylmuramic acid kinase [Petrachloros mirabilis ULC683]